MNNLAYNPQDDEDAKMQECFESGICPFCGDDAVRQTDAGTYCMGCGQLQEMP